MAREQIPERHKRVASHVEIREVNVLPRACSAHTESSGQRKNKVEGKETRTLGAMSKVGR